MAKPKQGLHGSITERIHRLRKVEEHWDFLLHEPGGERKYLLRGNHYCLRWACEVLEQAHREGILVDLTRRSVAYRKASKKRPPDAAHGSAEPALDESIEPGGSA